MLSVWWRLLDVVLSGLAPLVPARLRIRWCLEWRSELRHERQSLDAQPLTPRAFIIILRLPSGMFRDALSVRRYFDSSPSTASRRSREFFMLRDLRLAARSLIRSPGFSASAILTLSLGLGANAGIFHLLHSVALRPLPYAEPQELVAIKSLVPANVSGTEWGLSVAGYFRFRENADALDALAAYGVGEATLMDDGPPDRIRYAQSSANLPELLGARPALGRLFLEGEDRRGAPFASVLGYDFWQRRYGGDSSIVGRAINIDGTLWTVVGVMERGFHLPNETIDVWIAWHALNPSDPPRNSHFLQSIGRLAAGQTLSRLQAQLDQLTRGFPEAFPEAYSETFMEEFGFRTRATPLLDDVAGQTAETLWILLGSVGLVLLLASANVTNLVLVRSETRAREMSLRHALGATRWDLARQHFAEGVWIALAGGIAGTVVGYIGLRALMGMAPVTLPRMQGGLPPIGTMTVFFMVALSVAAAGLFSVMPLIRGHGATLDATRGTTGERHGNALRNVLVATQVAIGLVLIVAAAGTLGTVQRLRSTDPGFDTENLVTFDIRLPRSRYETQESVARVLQGILDRAGSLPGVAGASATSGLPLVSGSTCSGTYFQTVPLQPGQSAPCLTIKFVAPGYFRTMGIPLIRGVESQQADNDRRAGPIVITRTLADQVWPNHNPVGEGIVPGFMGVGPPWYHVAGVTDDLLHTDLDSPPSQVVFMPLRSIEGRYEYAQLLWQVVVRADPGGAQVLPSHLDALIRETDPNILIGPVESMGSVVARTMAPLSFTMVLLGIAAALALSLGFVGIYGVIAYLVARRRAEIGVRLALGARVAQVQGLVIGHSLKLAAAGIVVGVVGSFFAGRLMQRSAFEADPAGPVTVAIVAALLLAVACLASYLPSRRAAMIDPSEALRGE